MPDNDMASTSTEAAHDKRGATARIIFGVVVTTTLIGSQMIAVTAAFVYSLVIVLHITGAMAVAISVPFGVACLWGVATIMRLAIEAESDPMNI